MAEFTCEDLATKAELQELRNQLNAALGDMEGGGQTTIFEKGKDVGTVATAMALTFTGLTKVRASSALTDIVLETGSSSSVWQELENGTAKLTGFKGNGTKKTLESVGQVTKQVGANGGAAAAAAATAAKGMAMMAVLMSLVNIGATLALNYATVKVFDYRIDQEARGAQLSLDALNQGMLRLYEKNQGDIDAVNQEIDFQNNKLLEAENKIAANEADIFNAKNTNDELNTRLTTAQSTITDLQSQLAQTKNTINENASEFQEVANELIGNINTVEAELGQAIEIINEHTAQLAKNQEQIQQLELKVADLKVKYQSASLSYTELREEFNKLKLDLNEDVELIDARSKLTRARVILLENQASRQTRGGASVSLSQGTASAQNKTLELTKHLADSDIELETITTTDISNQTDKFDRQFTALLPLINPGQVNQEQIDEIVSRVNTDFGSVLDNKLGAAVIPALTTIADQTTQNKLASGTELGVCRSLNNPSCPGAGTDSNVVNGLKGMQQAIQAQADAGLAAIGLLDLAQGQSIAKIVKSTNEAVTNFQNGAKTIKEFMEKAWKATHADKILNAITTAVVIHNGVQLSTNLAASITDTASVVLDAMGIQDENLQPFDVTEILRTKLNSILTSLIGAENYATLTTKLAKYNRIYQASANVLNSAYDLFDSARSTAELTAENTGRIGNALLDSGVVSEDSYSKMIDEVNPQTKVLGRIEGFRNSLDSIDDTVSVVSNIASEVVSTKDSYGELLKARDDWKDANDALRTKKQETDSTIKSEQQVTADINDISFDKGEADTTATP